MGKHAIKIESLGKRYRIGERQRHKALRDVLLDVAYAPVRAAGRLLRGEGKDGREDSLACALNGMSPEVQPGEVRLRGLAGNLPEMRERLWIHDNGEASPYHARPQTPYQR